MKKIIYLFVFFAVNYSFGQEFTGPIQSYLQQKQKESPLNQQDINDVSVSSQSYSKSLNAYNVYVDQNYRGIKIFNSVSPFMVKDGQVVNASLSFVDNISAKINASTPSISALAAVSKATGKLGTPSPNDLRLLETLDNQSYVFSKGGISLENIPVQLVYQPMNEGTSLRLAWDLSIYLLDGSHYYSVRVDAMTGELLDTHDWVSSCGFGDLHHSHNEASKSILFHNHNHNQNAISTMVEPIVPQYRVFPIPLIGPNEGTDELLIDPSNAIASPYGWHDTDGAPGHEFTTTRGNNVLAREDTGGQNSGAQAEGGANLDFDFPYDLPQNPIDFLEAATTNLFYMNNIMHDVFYQYGFDEASGNFQTNNYGNGGTGGDHVIADAQDGSGMNNANFGTGPDGVSGRMQMYLWSPPGRVLGTFLTVNGGPLDGEYLAQDSTFAPSLPLTPITGDLVLVEDDSDDPYTACGDISNASGLVGKIAVVRRGDCNFAIKTQNAEDAGAIAVVIVNNTVGDPILMGGTGPGLTIPAIMIYKSDGEDIITSLIDGNTINATLLNDGSGNDTMRRDGDLDNVIVAHEYAHGISNRLAGGRFNSGCLQNQEQMGEGWSDYFALMLTLKAGDTGEDIRGIGNYALGQGTEGLGLRTNGYSTDFAINNFTYNNIKSQVAPHGVGSVWATMLWDLTWAFIDEYGFDEDIYNGNGGNNMALQLVIDGLKIQPCSPGFVDGRNAILDADVAINEGANQCLIWKAFAKRGLGFSADQGSSSSKMDGTQAFDLPVDCALGVGNLDTLKNKFVIYPNPSNGEINIQSRFDVQEATVSIYDMNGRKVFSQKVEMHNTANINASSLTAGMYMVKIEGGGYSQTSKLIIN